MAERVSDDRVTYAAKHPEDAFNLDEGADAEGVAAFVLDLRDCRAERDALREALEQVGRECERPTGIQWHALDSDAHILGQRLRTIAAITAAALARLQEDTDG